MVPFTQSGLPSAAGIREDNRFEGLLEKSAMPGARGLKSASLQNGEASGAAKQLAEKITCAAGKGRRGLKPRSYSQHVAA